MGFIKKITATRQEETTTMPPLNNNKNTASTTTTTASSDDDDDGCGTTKKPFLDQLDSATKTICNGNVFCFERFVPSSRIDELFSVLNNDDLFPWNLKPRMYGVTMPQHAYSHKRDNKKTKKNKKAATHNDMVGLGVLESMARDIERVFDGSVTEVWCNRFSNPYHHIEWHKDTYGSHIFVLSLGSTRRIEFRNQKSRKVEAYVPQPGDLYFLPLRTNETHVHRVCPDNPSNALTTPRLSFVFFFESPKYATKYRITKRQRLAGMFEVACETLGI